MLSIILNSVFKYYFQNDEYTNKLISFPALKGINLTIPQGSINLIMGPSGSGKTTLLEIMSSNLLPTSGTVIVDEIDIGRIKGDELDKFRWSSVGYLKQKLEDNFISDLTFFEMINLYKNNPLLDEARVREKVLYLKEYLDVLGLTEDHLNIKYQFLSGGEKQRLGLLFLMYKNPSVLLLDEPTSFLDEINKVNVINLLKKLKEEDITILITSHDHIFYKIADDIFFLQDGMVDIQNVFKILPDLISNRIILPLKVLNDNFSVTIPHLILKIFTYERILKYDLFYDEDAIHIDFTILARDEFYRTKMSEIYFHEGEEFNVHRFFDLKNKQLEIKEKESYWIIDKEQVSVVIKI